MYKIEVEMAIAFKILYQIIILNRVRSQLKGSMHKKCIKNTKIILELSKTIEEAFKRNE